MNVLLDAAKFKHKLIKKGIITVAATGILASAFFVDGKALLFGKNEEVVVASAKKPNRVIRVENIVVSKSREIDKQFSYESDHSYDFNPDDSPTFVRIKESDNWFIKGLKYVGKVAVGKEYDLALSSIYLIGYDMKGIEEDDLYFDEKDGVLYIQVPQFEIMYKPLFEIAKVEAFIGMFRFPYSEEERLDIYNEAIDFGYNLVINDPLIQQEAIKYIENSIKDRFSNTEKIEGKIKQVKIDFGGEFVKVEEDVLEKYKDSEK